MAKTLEQLMEQQQKFQEEHRAWARVVTPSGAVDLPMNMLNKETDGKPTGRTKEDGQRVVSRLTQLIMGSR